MPILLVSNPAWFISHYGESESQIPASLWHSHKICSPDLRDTAGWEEKSISNLVVLVTFLLHSSERRCLVNLPTCIYRSIDTDRMDGDSIGLDGQAEVVRV